MELLILLIFVIPLYSSMYLHSALTGHVDKHNGNNKLSSNNLVASLAKEVPP